MSAKETKHEAIVAPIRAKYRGKIAVFETDDGDPIVIAKPDNPGAYKDLFNQINKSDQFSLGDAYEAFALQCIKHPDATVAQALLNENPAFANVITRRGREFCGEGLRELGKD